MAETGNKIPEDISLKLAIFDFDGTLFPKDTLPFMLSEWKKQYSKIKYFRMYSSLILLYIKYKILKKRSGGAQQQSREQVKITAMEKFYKIFSGMTETEVGEFMRKCAADAAGLLNASVAEEISKARAQGFHTVLLSGAFENFLKYIGEYLKMDTVIGTKMNFKDGVFDPGTKPVVVTGELKLQRIRECFGGETVDWQASRAYADSFSDADILQSVGNPAAVHPDAALKVLADEKDWEIIA